MNEYHENRKKALEWWRKLSFSAQVSHTQNWQKQLGVDFMKGWHFVAVSKSDSAIQRIWEWSEVQKTKKS